MLRATIKFAAVALSSCLFASGALAAPVTLSDTELDAVAAGGVELVDGFVCPVISTENVLNSPKSGALGIEGFYTIGGPDVTVPMFATNGDGAGSPGGPFSMPTETDYTAIWSR